MLCGNCGHDERVHSEATEKCCESTCRCSEFEVWETEVEELGGYECGDAPEKSYVEFHIKIPRAHVHSFIEWLTSHDPDELSPEPMEIPDTIQTSDLDLDDPEVRRWLAEKIRSKN